VSNGQLRSRAVRRTFRQRVRSSIKTRLAVSHLAAVTASTFVYATGGFLLFLLVLYLSGYTTRASLIQLIPQFFWITLFVLVQIALITLCGIIVARIASRLVSRRMLKQIAELEEGSDAIAAGQLTRRVAVLTEDELGRLAERFNFLASRLSDADGQRRAFVANISHDLRTPIAIIQGHLDAQLDTVTASDLPPEQSFESIAHEIQTLSRLIEDLFTLSRLEEGVLPVLATAVDLPRLATDLVGGMRPYALKTARVSINSQIPDSLPKVLGDATRITQILTNLLHNAVRHTPEGGVIVVQAQEDSTGEWIEITVRDTGIGIPPDILGRIFERYYRGDTIGAKGGAGLGLSIVKHLVDIQGGTVWVESKVGEGTAIIFRLPSVNPPVRQ
jgi:signal transduction histidine kinase